MNDDRVIIFDTTLRDGEQSPGISLNTGEKLEIAQQLARLGVDVVTGGNIVMTPEDYLALLERERTAAQVERERLGGATEHREGGRSVPAP